MLTKKIWIIDGTNTVIEDLKIKTENKEIIYWIINKIISEIYKLRNLVSRRTSKDTKTKGNR